MRIAMVGVDRGGIQRDRPNELALGPRPVALEIHRHDRSGVMCLGQFCIELERLGCGRTRRRIRLCGPYHRAAIEDRLGEG